MKNKGVAKFWIEIIGGVILVAIVLVIVIFLGSVLSTTVEDSAAEDAFDNLVETMGDTFQQGEETFSYFSFSTSVRNRQYIIAYLPPEAVEAIFESRNIDEVMDRSSQETLSICRHSEIGLSLEPLDSCMCLIRLDYVSGCMKDFNLVVLENPGNLRQEHEKIRNWTRIQYGYLFDGIVTNAKVMSCARIISHLNCFYWDELQRNPTAIWGERGFNDPFKLRTTDGRTILALATSRKNDFNVESFTMKRINHYFNTSFVPSFSSGNIIHDATNLSKCYPGDISIIDLDISNYDLPSRVWPGVI